MGGAQAIAALAYGTETVDAGRRDRRARATPTCRRPSARSSGVVGIDGIAGPSELVVVADEEADPRAGRARPRRPGRARRRTRLLGAGHARARRCSSAVEREAAQLAAARRACRTRRWRSCATADLEAAVELAERDRARAPRARRARTPSSWPPRCARPAACSSAATAAPPSATTPPAPTTCCRPAARRASPDRSARARFGADRRWYRCPTGRRERSRRTSAASPAPRDSRSTPSPPRPGPTRRHERASRRTTQMATTTPPRAAAVERSTKETQIRLELALDGSGRAPSLDRRRASSTTCSTCSRATARLDLDGERRPATSRPARTTRPRTSGSCSARRSTRRSATAAASPATATRPCRWTRRSAPARSTSAAGRTARSRRTLPATSIARLRDRAGRGVLPRGRQQRQAHAAPARCSTGTNAHHMIEACFKAFARALRAGGRRSTTSEPGVPSTKGVL